MRRGAVTTVRYVVLLGYSLRNLPGIFQRREEMPETSASGECASFEIERVFESEFAPTGNAVPYGVTE